MSTEKRITDPDTGGQKGEKPEQMDMLPVHPLFEVMRVYAFGSQKYDRHNWRKGYKWSLSYNAAMRHMMLFWKGEEKDEESGLHHLAHAVFHMFALIEYSQNPEEYAGKDDRYI